MTHPCIAIFIEHAKVMFQCMSAEMHRHSRRSDRSLERSARYSRKSKGPAKIEDESGRLQYLFSQANMQDAYCGDLRTFARDTLREPNSFAIRCAYFGR